MKDASIAAQTVKFDMPLWKTARQNIVFPNILGVGTATPPTAYSQKEVLDLFKIDDRRTRLMFMSSAIDKRYLTIPTESVSNGTTNETQGDLLRKHREQALEVGSKALFECLENANLELSDVSCLCCVTSTGLLTPGLSALLCRELDLDSHCNRLDIVGMGCNAGLNGLNAAARWAESNPGKVAIVLCIEMCSAAYVVDGSIKTAVVNSLFGDGASAVALASDYKEPLKEISSDTAPLVSVSRLTPTIIDFSSCIITEALEAMKFDWDDEHSKFSFFLARDVPYVIGANVEKAVGKLLEKTGMKKRDISHWIVHSGGKKVIDSIKVNLGLNVNDLRHTTSVLRDYGNVSSGSFLFSYQRLMRENKIEAGDYGIMITMGPGATIETALIQW